VSTRFKYTVGSHQNALPRNEAGKNQKNEEEGMKKISMMFGRKIGVAVLCAVVALTSTAFAEEAKSAGLKPEDVKNALGMSIYLQGGYTYNGNASIGDSNDLRWLDHKANSFGLDLGELVFVKDPVAGAAGYKVKLSFGDTAQLIHSVGLGDTGQDAFDTTEAFVSYVANVGTGLRFDFGKMGTFIGAEVMEAKDDANYSRSFLFNYAEPLTHTGLKVSYAFTDAVNAAVFVLNGWDNVTDNNKAKTAGLSIGLAPSEMFSGYINVIQGAEQTDNSRDMRTLVDLVATIKPIKPLSIILNYDDGKEEKVLVTGDAKWNGLSGIVKYDINDTYSIAVRGEYFDDKDGYRTGTVQKLNEVTVTPEIRLDNGLIVRPEYRHDTSNKESFDNGTKKTQDTIALGVMYAW
jgi:hypothetical protein